jgi:hypothetical protein
MTSCAFTVRFGMQVNDGACGAGVAAHTGGFSAMDAKGDYVACCGYSMKGAHMQADSYMKVCV